MAVKGEIKIKDSGIATLKKIKEETKSLQETVKATSTELKKTFDKPYKAVVDTRSATQSIKSLKSASQGIKDVDTKIQVDDLDIEKVNHASGKIRSFGKMIVSPVIKIKDLTSSVLRRSTAKLVSFGKMVISPAVKLKDHATATLRSTIKLFKKAGNIVISPVVKVKDKATSVLRNIKNKAVSLGKIVIKPFVMLKDGITSKVTVIGSKLRSLGKTVTKPIVTLKDKVSPSLKAISGKIAAFAKGMVIPVTVAATVATAGIGMAVNSGMQLEQQQISMNHFIGATNKDMTQDQVKEAADAFTSALRENANATPFETGEVIQAGSRAVAVTQGNVTEAMSLVTLAEDMAAASGGTASIADAMEALADAKMGEMERLKSFGFKVSADEFKEKGFAGVSEDLTNFFGGASQKLATSGSGLLSTITGKLKSGISDFGLKVVDQLKPVFTDIIGFVDMAMPYIDKFGSMIANGIGNGIATVKQVLPSVINGIKSIMPPLIKFGINVKDSITNIATAAAPVVDAIISTFQQVLPVVEPIFSKIVSIITNVIVNVMPPLKEAVENIGVVINALAPVVSGALDGISTAVTNVINGITGVIQGGMDLISSLWSGNWQGVVDSFGTIFSGIGEICKAPINAVIGIINGAINGINSISVDIPDWVPVVGGEHWGMDLGEIPYLAKGGVVNRATTAVIGEQGKEAVVPLENNTGWTNVVAGKMISALRSIMSPQPVLQPAMPIPSGGDIYNININIDKLDVDPDNEDSINETGKKIAKQIIEALKNR